MSEPSNAQREAVISLMAEVWDDFVSDTGCFPDDFTILPRRRLQFVAGRWSGMVADALYGPNGPLATALAEAEARGRRQGLEEAAAKAEAQLAYWRERMRAEKCLEEGVSEDGEAYTPIGDLAAWEGGYCNGRMGEAEWWIGTLRSLATAPAETGESAVGPG